MFRDAMELVGTLMVIFVGVVLFIGIIFGIVMGFQKIGACKEAKIYNMQHQTEYTCSDFLWASDQINQSTPELLDKEIE